MRLIFETTPSAAVQNLVDRSPFRGRGRFLVHLFEADEVVPKGHHPEPLANWLRGLAAGEALQIKPPSDVVGGPPAVIPRALLDSLPADALLSVEWEMTR